MSRAVELKQMLLQEAEDILRNVCRRARGEQTDARIHPESERLVWNALVPILSSVDDTVPLARLTDGSIEDRVNYILEQVALGRITINQGKKLLELLQAGFGHLSEEDLESAKKLIVNVNLPETKKSKKKD